MSCIEACGILLWQQLQILLCFQMLLCLLLLISNLHRRQQFSLAKLLAKINLEVLQVSVSSCTQNLVQEAEKWKNSFSRWPFSCGQDSSDNAPAVVRTILNSGDFWSWWESGEGYFVMFHGTLPAWGVADLLVAF